jgi:hypothetical protein
LIKNNYSIVIDYFGANFGDYRPNDAPETRPSLPSVAKGIREDFRISVVRPRDPILPASLQKRETRHLKFSFCYVPSGPRQTQYDLGPYPLELSALGAAPVIRWTLPAGWAAGDLHWPVPQRIRVGPLTNYGYEDTVTLLVPVQGSASDMDIDSLSCFIINVL